MSYAHLYLYDVSVFSTISVFAISILPFFCLPPAFFTFPNLYDPLAGAGAIKEAVQNPAGGFGFSKERYNLSEMMFSMEKGGCAVAQANLEEKAKVCENGSAQNRRCSREDGRQDNRGQEIADPNDTKEDDAAAAENGPRPDVSRCGLAPWQEGVMERLREELSPQEYDMYVVHHGRMLITFGQIDACTPRDRDFVYGSLEPIEVQTLHSFKVTNGTANV